MAERRSDTEKRKILQEAQERFRRCESWEATCRSRFRDDVRFTEADAYNMWQWPADVQAGRNKRPMLTINRVRQHCLDILNDARQSRISVKIRPVRGGASYQAAEMLEGVIKHIEYASNASNAYQSALKFAVQGGIGYLRLATDYVGDDSFDQDVFVRGYFSSDAVLGVYLDPDIKEFDGSDASFGFVFSDMPRDQFDAAYPKFKDTASNAEFGPGTWGNLEGSGNVRICEYFRCVQEDDKLYAFVDPVTQERIVKRERDIDKEMLSMVIDDPSTAMRQIVLTKVEHFKIIGDNLAEENIWPGRYIPICRCVGEETVIEGQLDRKGHTRALLDSQRMMNYNAPLSLDTPLPTPTGWTTMGTVQPGDWLLGDDGHPVEVDGISPTFLMRDCYRVTFDDGSAIVADGEHRWTVEEFNPKRATAAEGRWATRTLTTAELRKRNHFIYVAKPLDLPAADLPVDPYVLGAWLGDGSSRGAIIHSGAEDADEMRAQLQACGYHVSEPRWYKGAGAAELQVWGLHAQLKAAGVLGNKHIPAAYLRGSVDQRLALLQGLMDTDGNFAGKGSRQCSWTSKFPALAEGFAELLRSLGLKATSQAIEGRAAKFPNGQTYLRQDARRFHFTVSPDVPAFRLERKLSAQTATRITHERRTKRHRIKSIERVPWVPTKCVGVKNASHLFLAGEGMVPTHNSGAVEYGALQNKVPYLAPAMAIEENQSAWENANTENLAVLTWKHMDDDGNPIPKPERQAPPMQAALFQQGMRDALEQMYLASGQNQADFGQPGNERSGVAIQQRQRQGDNATYHYLDHQATMVRFVGKQLLDLITNGKLYDTERLVKYRDDAGNEKDIRIDPNAEEAYTEQKDEQGKVVAIVINPRLGVYDVQADVGPAYATKRQEAFEAFSQLLAANKDLIQVVGDIWMRFADIPGANEAAERLKRMIPRQALEDGPSPDLVAAQEQIKALEGMIAQLAEKLESKQGEAQDAEEKNAIAGYKAVTDRVKALEKALALDPGGLMVLVKEVIEEAQAQSAGGNALEHAMDDDPAMADIHKDLGGQLQPPPPHAPPLDPNQMVPSATAAE